MGIPSVFAALLTRAKEEGVEFGDVATVGRQSLAVPLSELKDLAKRLRVSGLDWEKILGDGYSEGFLSNLLGATKITSFDYSSYQGVDVTHDFNQPLNPALHKSCDSLIDGGTLEHIFDVRTALANYMSLVRVGGSIFIHTPANNLLGHGFYQFSPELFFRVFSEENGFSVEKVCLSESPFSSVEISRHQTCYATRDPEAIGKRIHLVNDKPVMIFVHARRVADKPLFQSTPMQSDYSVKWKEHDKAVVQNEGVIAAAEPVSAFEYVSLREEIRRRRKQRKKHSFKNPRYFERIRP